MAWNFVVIFILLCLFHVLTHYLLPHVDFSSYVHFFFFFFMKPSPTSSYDRHFSFLKKIKKKKKEEEELTGLLKVCLFLNHIFKFSVVFLLGLPWSSVFFKSGSLFWSSRESFKCADIHISVYFLKHSCWFKCTAMAASYCQKSTKTVDSLSGHFIYNWCHFQNQAKKWFIRMVSIHKLR